LEKHVLAQYTELLKEREDIRRRLKRTEARLEKIEEGGCLVADSVTCGKRGKKPLGTKVIRGIPFPELKELLRRLGIQKAQLERAEAKVTESVRAAEDFIQGVTDSRMRRLLRYRYLDGLGWTEVAIRMGGRHTEDSCRMAVERFLAKK
jgi:DNA polymerase III epsilon subunit-like protein